jgi:subtilase family protein
MIRKTPRFALLTLILATMISTRSPAENTGGGVQVQQGSHAETATGLPAALISAVKPVVSKIAAAVGSLRPKTARPVRILVISSGVDTSLFPEVLRDKIRIASGGADATGVGTFAVTSLLQLVRDVEITSISVYDGEKLNAWRQRSALDWAIRNASKLDAVLYAVPPADFVDPTTRLLAARGDKGTAWADLLTAIGDHPMRARDGRKIFGLASAGDAAAAQARNASPSQQHVLHQWNEALDQWQRARQQLTELSGKGLPVVAPAGDLGPAFQTIFGIANLPEVITVGAFDGRQVASTSSSGPSLDNRVKPDLVAPGNLAGLLPVDSTLAEKLPGNAKLKLDWFTDAAPLAGKRIRVDSTIPAAAVVATQVATLRSGGIADARVLRGALTMAAVPLGGVPVWRQGAGVLRKPVNAAQVTKRGLVLGFGDFGAEPASGVWRTDLKTWHAQPKGARTTLTSFDGLGTNARHSSRTTSSTGVVKATVSNDGVTLQTGMGSSWQGGLYCGYTTVALPGSSQDVSPTVSGDGLPPGVREHVPTCLLNGSRLDLFGFYIHDEPAEDLTFALLPDFPERDTLMSGLPKHLPIDPFTTRLYQRVTGPDGKAYLNNVPPGYYRFREFSDYGSPISSIVRDADGNPVRLRQDIGENPSYQDVSGFLLSAANLTEDDLRSTFGNENVRKDKPTGTYLVTVGPKELRIVLNYFKKMPGPAVASRYIDHIGLDDLDWELVNAPKYLTQLATKQGVDARAAWPAAGHGWLIEGVNAPSLATPDANRIVARYNGVRSASDNRLGAILGVAQYPFNLTQPNYKTHFTLDFAYELQNAAIVALVNIDSDVETGTVVDAGVLRVEGDSSKIVPQITPAPAGSKGLASFSFDMLSHGVGRGLLTLLFVPSQAVVKEALPVARVTVEDLSMRVSTWTTALWPPGMNPAGMGHAFEVTPNVSTSQMNAPACRPKTAQGYTYSECEDWTVLVHSPGSDASTTNVRIAGADRASGIRSAGGSLFDPRRGSSLFSSVLAHDLSLADLSGRVNLGSDFRTNGRFWEQLAVPLSFMRASPGKLRFEIVDNLHGRSSPVFGHTLGGVEVAPFVPYANDEGSSELGSLVGTSVPLVRISSTDIRPVSLQALEARRGFVCDLA